MPYGRNISASTQGITLLVVALLLVQYAPLSELAGGGLDHHCVECTENYCTRDRCYCGHEHAHEPRRASSHNHTAAARDRSAASHDHTAAVRDRSAASHDRGAAAHDHSAAAYDHSAAAHDHSAAAYDHSAAAYGRTAPSRYDEAYAHESTSDGAHSARMNIAAARTGSVPTAATSTGSDARHHDHHTQATDHADEYGASSDGELNTPTDQSRRVAIRPCGTDNPQGIPVLQVDHFLLTDAGDDDVQCDDRPSLRRLSSSVYPQTAGDDVFHPPAGLA